METVFFVKSQSAVLNFWHLTSFAMETKETHFSVKSSWILMFQKEVVWIRTNFESTNLAKLLFLISLQVIYNCSTFGSNYFSVRFSHERKSEKINRNVKTHNPNLDFHSCRFVKVDPWSFHSWPKKKWNLTEKTKEEPNLKVNQVLAQWDFLFWILHSVNCKH